MIDPAQPEDSQHKWQRGVTFETIEVVQSIIEGLVETLKQVGAEDQMDRPKNWLSETQEIAENIVQLCDVYDAWVTDYHTFHASQEAALEQPAQGTDIPICGMSYVCD